MDEAKYMRLAHELEEGIRGGRYPAGQKLPSENELARTLNLSRQTVRQALTELEKKNLIEKKRGSGSVVRQGAAAQKRSGNVGVIATYIGEYIFPEMLGGIEETLREAGCSPLLSATRNRLDNERKILLEYLEKPLDGLIVEGTKTALPNPNTTLYTQLAEQGVPIVFVHGFYPTLSHFVHVVADDATGGYNAVRYLRDRGHENIAGIFKSDDIQGHKRYGGYVQGLEKSGLPIVDDRVLWYATENRERLIQDYALDTMQNTSAVVCYNDEVAIQLLGLLQAAGRRVPQDMAILSFDDSTYGNLTPVTISSFHCGERQVGRLAAQKLLGLLAGKRQNNAVLPWTLVEKGSV